MFGKLINNDSTFNLNHILTKIGRNPIVNDIILNHQSVSKEHCHLIFDSNKKPYLIDLNSINGTFVNGKKIKPKTKYNLNNNDIISFGVDSNQYKLIINENINSEMENFNSNNLLNSLNNNNLINKINENYLSQSMPIINQNNLLQTRIFNKEKQINLISSNLTNLSEEYNKLSAKYNALIHYASDIQKKNDILEIEIKEKNFIIEKYQNNDLGKIINEKDSIIKILQNENNFYNKELQNIKNCLNSSDISSKLEIIINEYLVKINTLERINEKNKDNFMFSEKKWNNLLKINENLQNQVDNLIKNWSDDQLKFNNLLNENDQKLFDALKKIPECFNNFDINKEKAANYLVNQVNEYLNEKNILLNELSILNKKNFDLKNENIKLKKGICDLSSFYNDFSIKSLEEKNSELKDALINLNNILNAEKKVNLENIIKELEKNILNKDKIIQELKEKILEFSNNKENLCINEKDFVNSISNALKNRDEKIDELEFKLKKFQKINQFQ